MKKVNYDKNWIWRVLKAGNFYLKSTKIHRIKTKYNRQRDKKKPERNWQLDE